MLNLASVTLKDPYYGTYYDDERHYRYDDDFDDSFENEDASSIVDTERNLRRYPSQVRWHLITSLNQERMLLHLFAQSSIF